MAKNTMSQKKPKKINQKISDTTSVKPPKILSPLIKATPKRKSRVNQEIRFYQKSCSMLMGKSYFQRQIRQILRKFGSGVERISPVAVIALQESVETFITTLYEKSFWCAQHAKRVTLFAKDIQLLLKIRDE